MPQKRPDTLRPELEQMLASRPEGVASEIRRTVSNLRPCVMLTSVRTGAVPLKGRWIDRALRRPPPAPRLEATTSKFGGTPYAEAAWAPDDAAFIGQINFAEVAQALEGDESRIPEMMPRKGLLAADLVRGSFDVRVRWYPDPAEDKAVEPGTVRCVARYEAAVGYRAGWSLRGLDWFDAVAEHDGELWDYMNDLDIPGVDEDARGGHKLFGHANEVLNELGGLKDRFGRPVSIRDHELVWRIDHDGPAGFAWGTNWIYVLARTEDLARGCLDHAFAVVANA